VVNITGAGVANMHLGAPDVGLTRLTEMASVTAAIADSMTLPILVEADTGFGNAVNMTRTIRVLERAGAACVQIEDQVFPKKCGHFEGKEVIPAAEMVQKIEASFDERQRAVQRAQAVAYYLVLIDVQMPVMDGLAATRAIRALPGGAAMPILAMTAAAFDEERVLCLAVGMHDFIMNPVNVTALQATLLRWLEPTPD
jgi:2-methylisocitrate lyase-like PEP mutase family enzyme